MTSSPAIMPKMAPNVENIIECHSINIPVKKIVNEAADKPEVVAIKIKRDELVIEWYFSLTIGHPQVAYCFLSFLHSFIPFFFTFK